MTPTPIWRFCMGRCLAALGKTDEARRAFVEARDRDVLRFRADSSHPPRDPRDGAGVVGERRSIAGFGRGPCPVGWVLNPRVQDASDGETRGLRTHPTEYLRRSRASELSAAISWRPFAAMRADPRDDARGRTGRAKGVRGRIARSVPPAVCCMTLASSIGWRWRCTAARRSRRLRGSSTTTPSWRACGTS